MLTKIDIVNYTSSSRKIQLNSKNELKAKTLKPLHYLHLLYHLNKGNKIGCLKVLLFLGCLLPKIFEQFQRHVVANWHISGLTYRE